MTDKYENIILVVNKAELRTAFELYNKLTSIGKKTLILTRGNVDIPNKRYSVRKLHYYQNFFPTTYTNITQDAYNLFSSLSKQKISENLTFRELTMYKEVSLWDASVRYVLPEFIPILHDFNLAEAVLIFERPCKIYISNIEDNLPRILGLICNKRQIPFHIYEAHNKKVVNLNSFLKKFVNVAKKIKMLLANLRFLFINLKKYKNLNRKYKVIFFASVRRYLVSILPVIFKYNEKERLVINTFASSSKKLKELKIPYMDFYGYKLYGLFDRNGRNLLRKIRKAINKNTSFGANLSYREVTIGPIIKNLFEKLIYEVFPHIMQKIDITRKVILTYRPRVIVVIDSSTDVVLTAKTLSIPVVAIQSNCILELCRFGPIVADAVTVDGSYWKEYLLKRQNVEPNKILATGPTKFDVILNKRFNIKSSDKIPNFNNSNTLKGTRKNVVFATTYMDLPLEMSEYERIGQFKSVCKAIRNIKEAHLIIKLHPYERDSNIYKEIAWETALTNFNILRNIEMLKLLHDCDLLITHTSTAAYEAVLLDKNVISLSGSSKFEPEDIWDFKKYDAALVIDDLDKLEKYIRSALFDPETISKLKRGRAAYICEHAYKLDGNASARVKQKIDSFLSTGS